MGAKQRRKVAERMTEIHDGGERVLIATGRCIGEGFHDTRLDTCFSPCRFFLRRLIARFRFHGLMVDNGAVLARITQAGFARGSAPAVAGAEVSVRAG